MFIDADFFIQKERYRTNAPSLMILAQTVVVENKVRIDLSCHRIPSYPDNQVKARNGYYHGDDGYNIHTMLSMVCN